jgi:hypothetical protein
MQAAKAEACRRIRPKFPSGKGDKRNRDSRLVGKSDRWPCVPDERVWPGSKSHRQSMLFAAVLSLFASSYNLCRLRQMPTFRAVTFMLPNGSQDFFTFLHSKVLTVGTVGKSARHLDLSGTSRVHHMYVTPLVTATRRGPWPRSLLDQVDQGSTAAIIRQPTGFAFRACHIVR